MSELKSTPGPWHVDATHAFGPMGIYSDDPNTRQELSGICWFGFAREKVNGVCQSRETIEANAALIAATPDLLAACLFFTSRDFDPAKAFGVMKSAIIKAIGQDNWDARSDRLES